jgi:hypothetical protein
VKTTLIWALAGVALAAICGFSGLHHLSASVITLTLFCTVPALAVIGLDAISKSSPSKMTSS